MLDPTIDPKLAWALRNRDRFPVDINTADREMLLRIPGLGVRSVDQVIRARVHNRLRLDDLKRLAGSIQRLRPFVVTADHRPTRLLDVADLRTIVAPKVEQIVAVPMIFTRQQSSNTTVWTNFRCAARKLLAARIAPSDVTWGSEARTSHYSMPLFRPRRKSQHAPRTHSPPWRKPSVATETTSVGRCSTKRYGVSTKASGHCCSKFPIHWFTA